MVLLSVAGLTMPPQVLAPAGPSRAGRVKAARLSQLGYPSPGGAARVSQPGYAGPAPPAECPQQLLPAPGLPGPAWLGTRCPRPCHRPRALLGPWHLPPVIPRCPRAARGQQGRGHGLGPGVRPGRAPGRGPGLASPARNRRAGAGRGAPAGPGRARAPSLPPQHLPRAAAARPPSCATRNPPGEGGAAAAGTGKGGLGGPSTARAGAAVPGECRAGHRGEPGAATLGARAGRARATTGE